MKVKSDLFSPSKNLDSLLAAMIGFVLIQIFSKHSGIGVSPDSVTYISATRHMMSGMGFRSFDNLPVVDFPFAYPFYLTIISFFTKLDPLQFGAWLNGILIGILLYISGGIMNGFSKSNGWYKRILLLCILFSPALQEIYSMLWSETVFLILILLFIRSISNYLRFKTYKWLWISTGICALSCLTRYAGVFMVVTGVIIIFFSQDTPWRKRIMDSFIFGSLSISLLLINVVRNIWATGLATGVRPRNEASLLTIMEYFGGVLCDWLLIDRRNGLAVILTIAVLLVFALIIVFRRFNKSGGGVEYVIAVTGFVYSAFMLFSYSIIRYEPFTSRLLSPIFVPILWSVSSWIPDFIARKSYEMKWAVGIPVLLLTAWFLNRQLSADWEYYDGVKDAGIPGYREDPFVYSEIVQFLEKNKKNFNPRFPIYSNAGDAVYFVTGLPALQLPFIDFPSKVEAYYKGYDDRRGEYLVWFQNEENLQMPDLNSILKNKNMILFRQLRDGAVYTTK